MTRYLPIVSLVAAAIVGNATSAPAATTPPAVTEAAALASPDTGDSLWRRAREALSDGDYDRAAELFGAMRERFPKSAYAGESYYWQAFAMSRDGSRSRLRRALELLTEQGKTHAAAATVKSGEARTLATRLRGQLARSGDADAAEAVAERAREISRTTGSAAGMGAAVSDRDRSQMMRDQRQMERDAAQMNRNLARAGDRGRSATPPGCKDEDEDDRVEALNALLQMNAEQAVPILKKVLDRRDQCSELLRRKAVFLVAQKRSDETADILLKAAKTDPDAETRDQAIFWLSQVSGEKAEEFLLGILKESKDEEVQKRALFSLSQRRSDKSQAALREYASRADAPAELRQQAVFWIGQRKSEENARFLRDLFGRATDDDVREKVLFSLSQMRGMGNETFILEQAANTKLPIELRKQALFWAAQGTGVSTAQLSAIYDKNSDGEMREQVIFTLSQRGNRDTAAVDKLLDIAKNEKDRELRKKAIFWLGQSKDPRAAKLLQELIDR
jgi:HEAT repeat protein